MSKEALSLISCMLAALLPAQLIAGDSVGVLTNVGTVLVDSRQATFTTAVFAGEVIETKARSTAVVNGNGRMLSLGENSTLRLGSTQVQLESGSLVVTSSSAFTTEVAGVKITTDSAIRSRFIASRAANELKVVTLEGKVFFNDGQQTTPVPATRGISLGIGNKDKSSSNYPGAKKTTWLGNDDIGLLIVIAAGVAAGVSLGVVNALNNKPVSP